MRQKDLQKKEKIKRNVDFPPTQYHYSILCIAKQRKKEKISKEMLKRKWNVDLPPTQYHY